VLQRPYAAEGGFALLGSGDRVHMRVRVVELPALPASPRNSPRLTMAPSLSRAGFRLPFYAGRRRRDRTGPSRGDPTAAPSASVDIVAPIASM
jgi:hypothetical protein